MLLVCHTFLLLHLQIYVMPLAPEFLRCLWWKVGCFLASSTAGGTQFSQSSEISICIPRLSSLLCVAAVVPLSVPHPCGFLPLHKNPFTVMLLGFQEREKVWVQSAICSQKFISFFIFLVTCVLLLLFVWHLIFLSFPLGHKLPEASDGCLFIIPILIPTPIF